MPRPRPPFLRREVTRHGNVVWYVRKGEGQRIRIRSAFGTLEFEAEYQAALSGTARPQKYAPTARTALSRSWLPVITMSLVRGRRLRISLIQAMPSATPAGSGGKPRS